MGHGGQTANGSSSLGPNMGKAHGGGVKLEQGMGKISQSQDDVLSGKETQMEDNSMGNPKKGIISGGHSKGGFMKHAKGSYGQPKAKIMVKGPDGKPVPNYAVDGDGSKDLKKSPGKFDEVVLGGNKGDKSKSKPGETDYKK